MGLSVIQLGKSWENGGQSVTLYASLIAVFLTALATQNDDRFGDW